MRAKWACTNGHASANHQTSIAAIPAGPQRGTRRVNTANKLTLRISRTGDSWWLVITATKHTAPVTSAARGLSGDGAHSSPAVRGGIPAPAARESSDIGQRLPPEARALAAGAQRRHRPRTTRDRT